MSLFSLCDMSRLLKMIGLFCKWDLSKRRYSAKETCIFKEPTNRSHLFCKWDLSCDMTLVTTTPYHVSHVEMVARSHGVEGVICKWVMSHIQSHIAHFEELRTSSTGDMPLARCMSQDVCLSVSCESNIHVSTSRDMSLQLKRYMLLFRVSNVK